MTELVAWENLCTLRSCLLVVVYSQSSSLQLKQQPVSSVSKYHKLHIPQDIFLAVIVFVFHVKVEPHLG